VKIGLDVERLLQWAYRDELPKQSVGGLTGWEQRMYLGTEIDRDSDYEQRLPVILGPPHPDALTIDYFVRSIDDVRIQWPSASRLLLGHLFEWVREEDMALCQAMVAQASELVQAHARMGTRPHWRMDLRVVPIRGRNGKPVIHGITDGRRYAVGAHGKVRLDPSAAEILAARFEYFVWHSTLRHIATSMWPLEDYQPKPPAVVQTPWLYEPPAPLTFYNSPSTDMSKRPLKPQRPRVLPPLASPLAGPVFHPQEEDAPSDASSPVE